MISTKGNKIANSWTNQKRKSTESVGEKREVNGKGDESHRPVASDRK